MDIANDNELIPEPDTAPDASILPAPMRDMLEQCDRVGIGLDVVMSVLRARLRAKGFHEGDSTEQILAAFRHVLERHR